MSLNFSRTITLLGALIFLAGCAAPVTPLSTQEISPAPAIITETVPAVTLIPTNTLLPVNTLSPSATAPAPTNITATGPASSSLLTGYLDDRSTAIGVIQSLYNAINRREYVRAYSYWESPGKSTQPGVPASFAQFQQGYENTISVQVVFGQVGSDLGAGQIYDSVPVGLIAQTTTGQNQVFSGCYVLHLARPEIQDAPPYQPMGIFSAQVKQQEASANADTLAVHGCDYLGPRQVSPTSPMPTTNPGDITSANYLDDRSDPILVLRSLFNAINSKQYDRAYSYWNNPSSGSVPPYDQFKQGYQKTESVEATFGKVTGNGAAGNFYFTVPTALKVKTTDGSTQTFVGCYLEHMADPGVFGTPPYVPLGIERAKVQQVDNHANIDDLLSKACENMP